MVKVAAFIAEYLYAQGITDIFTLSGGGAIYLDQAVTDHPGLREVCIKNEATGPMMAKAYARVKNNFGVVYVTSGPGGANAVTGVAECYVDSSPVLVISGQAPLVQTTGYAKIQGLRSFGVQELNIVEIVKPITKYAAMVVRAEDIQYELQRAIHIMKSDRPGPVWLDIPLDIQAEEVDPTMLRSYSSDKSLPDIPRYTTIEDLVYTLRVAQRPLIVAGQGILGAVDELKSVAELLDAPIILSRMGLDALPFSYRQNMGIGGIRGQKYNKQIMREADVVLAVGTSLSVAFAGHNLSFFDKDAAVYMVDIEEVECLKIARTNKNFIRSDAKVFLSSLLGDMLRKNWTKTPCEWTARCVELKYSENAAVLAPARNPIDVYYLAKMLDDMSTENDYFVDDAGSIYYVASQTLSFNKGQKEITSGAFASMGNAIPLAIGCAVADPKARVLAMTGDGSLETNVQELKTLSYYGFNVKLFVINNGGYISMRDHGRFLADERSAMLNLKKVAAAYDMEYYRVAEYQDFTWVRDVISQDGPAFFEVMCDDEQKLILPR